MICGVIDPGFVHRLQPFPNDIGLKCFVGLPRPPRKF